MNKKNESLRGLTCALVVGLAIVVISVRSSRADAPSGRYTLTNDTAADNKTKLMWQRGTASTSMTWNDAKAYCMGLVLESKDDWRLPTIKELQSIVDETRTNPAIDMVAFPSTPPEWFWTSSLFAGSGSAAWIVAFSFGKPISDGVGFTYRVRCVR